MKGTGKRFCVAWKRNVEPQFALVPVAVAVLVAVAVAGAVAVAVHVLVSRLSKAQTNLIPSPKAFRQSNRLQTGRSRGTGRSEVYDCLRRRGP